jgi:hypothetical protein
MKKLFTFILAISFSTLTFAQSIGLVGSSAGWNNDVVMNTSDNVTYTLTAYTFTIDGLAKFRQDAGWAVNWGSSSFPTGTGTQGGADIPVPAGTYDITFEITTGNYSFTAVSTGFVVIGFTGGFNNFSSVEPMITTDGNIYTKTDFYFSGGDVKFVQPQPANTIWGGTSFPVGTAQIDGQNIPLTPGFYNITFDINTLEYTFDQVPIGIIGTAVPPYDWSVDVPMSSTDGGVTNYLYNYTIIDGLLKFRANGGWTTNWGGGTGFPSGTASLGAANIPVAAETYDTISFNRLTGEYCFGCVLCSPTSSIQNVTACTSFSWNGNTYTQSGTYTYNTTNATGCDSTATLNLTINNGSAEGFTITECDSYPWNGQLYSSSGTYFFNDCGAIDTLYLTIITTQPVSISVTNDTILSVPQQSGVDYQWINCNSNNNIANENTNTFIASMNGNYAVIVSSQCGTETSNCENVSVLPPKIGMIGDFSNWTSDTLMNTTDYVNYILTNFTFASNSQVKFRQDASWTTNWGSAAFPSGIGVQGGANIPVPAGTYDTISFNRITGEYNFSCTVYSTQSIQACVSYSWNSNTYTQSGTYTFNTFTSNGCDSIATLILTINQPNGSTTTDSACGSYDWNGTVYTQSGTYTFDTISSIGCDSSAILILTVNYSPQAGAISVSNDTILSVPQQNGLSYQWINCANNSSISGANSNTLNVSVNGSYAVIVSNQCGQDTSNCQLVQISNVSDINLDAIQIYPNPTGGKIVVDLSESLLNNNYKLMDFFGRTVLEGKIVSLKESISLENLSSGTYLFKLDNSNVIQTVVKF